MDAFARVAGDHNPLHRCVLAARLGGLARPIVHGAWTAARASAFVIDDVCAGDATALRRWRIALRRAGRARRRARAAGGPRRAAGRPGGRRGDGARRRRARRDRRGVGRAAAHRARPSAARACSGAASAPTAARARAPRGWSGSAPTPARARAWASPCSTSSSATRPSCGSPTAASCATPTACWRAPSSRSRRSSRCTRRSSPSCARRARSATTTCSRPATASASSPRSSRSGCSSSRPRCELVFARGELMQREVARDAAGARRTGWRSSTRRRAALSLEELEAVVAAMATCSSSSTTTRSGASTRSRARGRRSPRWRSGSGRAPCACCPGSTSRFTRRGSRRPSRRCARSSSGSSARSTRGGSSGAGSRTSRAGRSRSSEDGSARDAAHRPARAPGRLAGAVGADAARARSRRRLGARRIVELGPAGAPVLTGLMRLTLAELELPGAAPELLHVESDRDAVLALTPAPVAIDAAADRRWLAGPRPPAASPPPAAAHRHADRVGRTPPPTGRWTPAPRCGSCSPPKRACGPSSSTTTSRSTSSSRARRRAATRCCSTSPASSACRAARASRSSRSASSCARCATQGAHYRFPGPYLRDTVAAGLTRALGRAGLSRADAAAHLASAWGLGPGLADHVLALLALETRPGPSARGGALGRLAEASRDDARRRPRARRPRPPRWPARRSASRSRAPRPASRRAPAPRPADPLVARAVAHVEQALADSAHALLAGLGATRRRRPSPDPERERLALLDDELGPGRAREVAPRFDHRRHVRFASAWASARWDLVAAYHDGLRGELDEATLRRVAAHGADPVLARTAAFLAERCDGALATALHAVAAGHATPALPSGRRPTADGDVDDPARPHDLLALVPPELHDALTGTPDLRGETALVTGASPGSIARRARAPAAARRRDRRRRDLDRHARAAALVPRAVPRGGRPRRRAARPAREPRVVRRHRRARGLARAAADERARAARPAHRPAAPDDRRAVRRDRRRPATPATRAPDSELALRLQLLGVQRLVGRDRGAGRSQGAPAPTILLPLLAQPRRASAATAPTARRRRRSRCCSRAGTASTRAGARACGSSRRGSAGCAGRA